MFVPLAVTLVHRHHHRRPAVFFFARFGGDGQTYAVQGFAQD